MSVYFGELTPRCTALQIKKMQSSFPALTSDFYSVLADRLRVNNYCDERLKNAVDYVIDNCVYPTPTIAQFISFDKRMKLYTYHQVLEMNKDVGSAERSMFKIYRPVKIGDYPKAMYAHVNDINEFKLKLWKK